VDIQEEGLLKYTVQNHLKNYFDTSYCRSSKKRVELQLLLMLNMHSIEIMLKIRVDIENLIISQPDNGEQALKLLKT
jgi:hypothetical protein